MTLDILKLKWCSSYFVLGNFCTLRLSVFW